MDILAKLSKYKSYFKELIILAMPMIFGNLGQTLIGATDVFVASKHSVDTLASISIANSILFCTYIIGIGLMSGISIVLANFRGNRSATKKFYTSSISLSFILSSIFCLVSLATIPLVDKLGFEAGLVPSIKEYMFICSFSFFGMYLYQSIKEFLQAHEIVNFPNAILVVALIFNAFFDFALVFGFGFIPALGVKGLAVATLVTRTLMGLVLLIYSFRLLKLDDIFDNDFVKQVLKIGYPIGFALLLEFLGFNIITILIGRESGILASTNSIIITILSINFMVPLALSNALAIKVGFYNGAKNYLEMRNYSFMGTFLAVLFMGICSIILFFFPAQLIGTFTTDARILEVGVPILLIAALFEMVDGYQISLGGILKGLKMTRTVSICTITGYWVLGLPLGFFLAYKYDMSLMGFWIGLAVSFLCIAVIQQIIIARKFKELKEIY